ncbi:MAG: hypothetical protein ACOC2D_00555 [Spirochaetota bacterium]
MTIGELYELFDTLRPHRRRAASAILELGLDADTSRACRASEPCRQALERLQEARERLDSLPGEGPVRELSVDGREVRLTLDYELSELDRDLLCLREGMEAVVRTLRVPGSFETEYEQLVGLLSDHRYAAVFTDRDGTIANYCGRYRSSHQPLYAAVRIGRYARERTDNFVVVTSGPLYGQGLLSLSAFPEGTVHLTGSKGLEYLFADGETGSYPLTAEQRAALIALDHRIEALLERPEYHVLPLVGSGYQRKFGQLTVSRQDMHRSVPAEVSQSFLDDVHRVVSDLDPYGERIEVVDTGFDIELTLTAEGSRSRGFDKGDGVGFLLGELGLRPRGEPVLVCGDTASDLPMVEFLADAGYEVDAVFVAADAELERAVRRRSTRAGFCSGPDVLVSALGAVGRVKGAH